MRNIMIIMMVGIVVALGLNDFRKGAQQPASSQTQEQYLQSQGVGAPQIPQPAALPPVNENKSPSGQNPGLEPASRSGVQKFVVYTVKGDKDDHFVPSGWMGDYDDLMMHDPYTGNCHSKNGCIQFVYNAQKSQGAGWAGIYWQNPADNWGGKQGGYNLVGMKKLTFWARGENGTEQIDQFLVGGITGTYPDSTKVVIGPVKLTNRWQQYTINLSDHDFSYINGAFGWIISAGLNPRGGTFYLDTIQFEGSSLEIQKETIGGSK